MTGTKGVALNVYLACVRILIQSFLPPRVVALDMVSGYILVLEVKSSSTHGHYIVVVLANCIKGVGLGWRCPFIRYTFHRIQVAWQQHAQ